MAVAPTEIRTLARSYTKAAINTLVGIMRQPKARPAARVMAANALLDRGWGKAAQLVAVDGEIRQLVEVKLNVVTPNNLEQTTTKLLTNPEKPNDINAVDLSDTERAVERRQGRQVIPPEDSGPSSGRGQGKVSQGDPVKTTLDGICRLDSASDYAFRNNSMTLCVGRLAVSRCESSIFTLSPLFVCDFYPG